MSSAAMSLMSPTLSTEAWQARMAASGLHALRDLATAHPFALSVQRFVFLRHGETEGNVLKVFQPEEISLNEHGRAQAEAAASLLREVGIERICASDMQRAWETATIVAGRCDVPPQPDPALRERWFGDWVGTSSANLDWRRDPPGGESLLEFVRRTQRVLEATLSDPAHTLVVAHGGNLYVLAFSLGLEVTQSMIQNATPLAFECIDGRWSVSHVGAETIREPLPARNAGW